MLVGSSSIPEGILNRKLADVDWILTFEDFSKLVEARESQYGSNNISVYPLSGRKYVIKHPLFIDEVSIAWEGSLEEELLTLQEKFSFDPLDVYYTMKMSHRFLKNSPHFKKTIDDIEVLREAGAKIPDELQDWYKRLEARTYDYGHPKLNQNKENFFNTEGVTYTYDHDSLHEAVKIWEKPAYTYFIKDGEEVLCDKEKFQKLPYATQLSAVVEESMVLALERCLVPFGFATLEREAFLMALEKVCTSITSGWFRDFAWENYKNAVKYFDSFGDGTLTKRFVNGVESNTIKLFREAKDGNPY